MRLAAFSHPRRTLFALAGPSKDAVSFDSRPCLVYLVRAVNGIEPVRAFARALRLHPAGLEHDLVLAMKGFSSSGEAEPHLRELSDFAPQALFFADEGLDLGVYFSVAAQLRRESYCFANSYSVPLSDDWLAKLYTALGRPGVGLAGATGSWASVPSWVSYTAHLPSAYRGVLPEVSVARAHFLAIELERTDRVERPASESLQVRLRTLLQLPEQLLGFERFPAQHLRTNAFMVSHATLRRLRLHEIRTKMDAYVLESGRASITRQVQGLGLRTVVVDRAGELYDPEQWHRSHTLWQGDQEGLLVADNQTLCYTHGDSARRRLLSGFAWGGYADPHLPDDDTGTGGAVLAREDLAENRAPQP